MAEQYVYNNVQLLMTNFKGLNTNLVIGQGANNNGIVLSSGLDKNLRSSGMILTTPILLYQYQTYSITVTGYTITPGAQPFIYPGFLPVLNKRIILNNINQDYTMIFNVPITGTYEMGVLFTHKHIITHTVVIKNITIKNIENNNYVKLFTDDIIPSNKTFTGNNIITNDLTCSSDVSVQNLYVSGTINFTGENGIINGYNAGGNINLNSITLGKNAGTNNLLNNTIVINAGSQSLNPVSAGLFVKPISNKSGVAPSESATSRKLYYNETTGEIFFYTG